MLLPYVISIEEVTPSIAFSLLLLLKLQARASSSSPISKLRLIEFCCSSSSSSKADSRVCPYIAAQQARLAIQNRKIELLAAANFFLLIIRTPEVVSAAVFKGGGLDGIRTLPAMSSLRNAIKRRTHKERSQPADRNRLGLLEKHKDYVLRAKDFHKKEKTIQILKEKAAFKNPDEFYYKMINSKTVNGIHRSKIGAKEYSQDELLLMKTQDIRYVLNKAQSEQKKVERLHAVLHSIGQTPSNTHVYFAEDRLEAENLAPGAVEKPEKKKELPRVIRRKQNAAYRELEERCGRADKMKNMVISMTLKKQLMGKGRKHKVRTDDAKDDQEPVFKWKQERKK